MSNFEVMSLNIQANIKRIEQLLAMEGIEKKFIQDRWYSSNKANVELRQRLKMLRKDTLALEKEIR